MDIHASSCFINILKIKVMKTFDIKCFRTDFILIY